MFIIVGAAADQRIWETRPRETVRARALRHRPGGPATSVVGRDAPHRVRAALGGDAPLAPRRPGPLRRPRRRHDVRRAQRADRDGPDFRIRLRRGRDGRGAQGDCVVERCPHGGNQFRSRLSAAWCAVLHQRTAPVWRRIHDRWVIVVAHYWVIRPWWLVELGVGW